MPVNSLVAFLETFIAQPLLPVNFGHDPSDGSTGHFQFQAAIITTRYLPRGLHSMYESQPLKIYFTLLLSLGRTYLQLTLTVVRAESAILVLLVLVRFRIRIRIANCYNYNLDNLEARS